MPTIRTINARAQFTCTPSTNDNDYHEHSINIANENTDSNEINETDSTKQRQNLNLCLWDVHGLMTRRLIKLHPQFTQSINRHDVCLPVFTHIIYQ